MIVAKDKVVSLIYELRIDQADGKIIESLNADAPLTFLYGASGLLPKFEEEINGLAEGVDFDFNLKPADAYGEIREEAIIAVPLTAFQKEDGEINENLLKIGNNIPMQDASGNKLDGIVKEVGAETVKMDFNHPLAGNALFFKGKITEIREPNAEELSHGHARNSGTCGSCPDCSCEGDGCQ